MTKKELQVLAALLETIQQVFLKRREVGYIGDPPRLLGEDHSDLIAKFRSYVEHIQD